MDLSEVYDNKLTIISQYHEYLTDVIRKGYNNNIDMLILIDKHINNFLNEAHKLVEDKKLIIDKPNTQSLNEPLDDNDNYNNSSSSDSNDSDTDSNDSDTDNSEQNKKELNKIDNFIINSDDLSKIYIYNINNNIKNNYINKMKKFINNNNY
jgi:hypothetical protein